MFLPIIAGQRRPGVHRRDAKGKEVPTTGAPSPHADAAPPPLERAPFSSKPNSFSRHLAPCRNFPCHPLTDLSKGCATTAYISHQLYLPIHTIHLVDHQLSSPPPSSHCSPRRSRSSFNNTVEGCVSPNTSRRIRNARSKLARAPLISPCAARTVPMLLRSVATSK